jgi:hypothetical protein
MNQREKGLIKYFTLNAIFCDAKPSLSLHQQHPGLHIGGKLIQGVIPAEPRRAHLILLLTHVLSEMHSSQQKEIPGLPHVYTIFFFQSLSHLQ